ncbi:MAG TPA: SDR family NAD(P)-dependent oxidoreductase [Xanthobacteraceae bacterium]|jgi:CDP-paratose 2-epimerase|nr:SDR family NAD(P)-dependent oxidoreductase [Xanthobacteraceae bacterium]
MNVIAKPRPRGPGRRVLVTGGCGFLGCNMAAALATRGQDVVVLDNLSRRGSRENADWLESEHRDRIKIEVADVRDAEAVRTLVEGAAGVLHLAAQVAVTTSLDHPREDLDINVGGTLNLLEAVRRHNPRAPVVFASTNKVYGQLFDKAAVGREGNRYVPRDDRLAAGVSESAPLDLYSPYGCSKGAADQYVRDYARVFGLRTAVMRMSCIYGPRQFGTEDQGWIAHFLIQTMRNLPITVYGNGYQVRDALYVADAVDAWLRVLDGIDAVSGEVFNLGGGPENSISLRELLDEIELLQRGRPSVHFARWRPGDQPWYVSDTSKLSQSLGWSPRTSLGDGLRLLHRWLSDRFSAPDAPALHEAHA